jgi:hypothetical protein
MAQEAQLQRTLSTLKAKIGDSHYDVALMRNVLGVDDAMEAGHIDLSPVIRNIVSSLQSDAVVLSFTFESGGTQAGRPGGGKSGAYTVNLRMRLADVIIKADEAVTVSRKLLQRMTDTFGKDYKVEMVAEPATASAKRDQAVTGSLLGGKVGADDSSNQPSVKERFYTVFKISKS